MNSKRLISHILVACIIATAGTPHAGLGMDLVAPVIHPTLELPPDENANHRVSARVTDDQEIASVRLKYRSLGSIAEHESVEMKRSGDTAVYEATIEASALVSPGIEYFFEAQDRAGNVSQFPFPNHPRTIAIDSTPATSVAEGKMGWVWAVVGALALGALAAGGGGSGSGSSSSPTGTLVISAELP